MAPSAGQGGRDRMKIGFAMIHCNRREGSARAVNEVAERLARRHEVHLFARQVRDIDLSLVRWRKMPGPAWPDFVTFATYHLLAEVRIQSKDFNIVHSIGNNAMAANVITIQNIQPAKRKYMNEALASEKTFFARKLAKRLYLDITTAVEHRVYTARPGKRPPLFLPVSRGVERELREHYDIGEALVRIIPNAADTEIFRPIAAAARAGWRTENGFLADDVILAFAGGEWSRKGLDLAIRALALLPDSKVKLFVAGQDADQRRFAALASGLGVGERVVFGGFCRNVATALAAADVFLFPSWYEAFSLATIEAAACGLPIVASKINGAEDFVRPGINGEFIEHQPEQIAGVLRNLLSDRTKLIEMGLNARKDVEDNYTWDRVARMTEAAYLEYLERP